MISTSEENLNPASVSAKASHFETPSSDLVVAAGLRSEPCLFRQLLAFSLVSTTKVTWYAVVTIATYCCTTSLVAWPYVVFAACST